jgi:FAD/FMN-containing dehydrogenase
MNPALIEELKKTISGDVDTSSEMLTAYNHDASIFSLTPQVVVFPKDGDDVKALVKFVATHKKDTPDLSLTARAASTCMSGGGLSDSIVVGFTKYFNHPVIIEGDLATVDPGVYYRDFEKQTLEHNMLFPTYPSSREICALGGMINNNCGGEKSLQYGKTEDWVRKMRMVLADGNTYEFGQLNEQQLREKMKLTTFEGEIYKKMYELITTHYDVIKAAKPQVSKNSAGYYLWNVYDKQKGIFDLTKLFVGAQGTLGLMLDATVQLVPVKKHK